MNKDNFNRSIRNSPDSKVENSLSWFDYRIVNNPSFGKCVEFYDINNKLLFSRKASLNEVQMWELIKKG